MSSDWEKAKVEYINRYFSDDECMQNVAEQAFNGIPFYQEKLAEWFDERHMSGEAEKWKKQSRTNRESMGTADER